MGSALLPICRNCECSIRYCLISLRYKKVLILHSPEGLREVFLTGGLPPLVNSPDPVYEKTYRE